MHDQTENYPQQMVELHEHCFLLNVIVYHIYAIEAHQLLKYWCLSLNIKRVDV